MAIYDLCIFQTVQFGRYLRRQYGLIEQVGRTMVKILERTSFDMSQFIAKTLFSPT